jgi:predicted 2-oxoglutarate/Fe(II)-dependent dioxygenase YbiX
MKQEIFILKKKILTKNQCELLIKEYNKRKNESKQESCTHANTGVLTTSTFKKVELTPNTKNFNNVHKAVGKMIKSWISNIEKNKTAHSMILKNRTSFTHQYRLMCYEKGGWIHPHVDFEDFSYASCTINLNEDYKGGVFYFFNKEIKFNLKQGESIIFPNNPFWIHEVSEVTQGKRYSVNCFILSLPFDVQSSINQQVFEMRKQYCNSSHPFYHKIYK